MATANEVVTWIMEYEPLVWERAVSAVTVAEALVTVTAERDTARAERDARP